MGVKDFPGRLDRGGTCRRRRGDLKRAAIDESQIIAKHGDADFLPCMDRDGVIFQRQRAVGWSCHTNIVEEQVKSVARSRLVPEFKGGGRTVGDKGERLREPAGDYSARADESDGLRQ